MQLSARHVGELAAELAPLVVGRRISEVVGLPPRDLLLVLEAEGAPVRRLRVSAESGCARLHLQIGRLERRETAKAPFFQRATELLTGWIVEELDTPGADRIARLVVRSPAGGPRRALVAELFARGANLCLLVDDKVDAVCLRPKGAEARARARLVPGEPYRAPTGGARPAGEGGDPPLHEAFPEPPARAGLAELAPLSWRVEAALGGAAEERFDAGLRKELSTRIARKERGVRKRLEGLRAKAAAGERAERVRQDGELLKASAHTLPRGSTEAVVQDWFTDGAPERRLALDPKLSPIENAERYFARYKKHLRAIEHLPAEIAVAEDELARLAALRERLDDPSTDPAALEAEAVRARLLPRRQVAPERRNKPAPRLPYKVFSGSRGGEIRVGRTAKDNDRLSFRESRGNDLWLHTRDSPGSHVVLRVPKGREPDEDEILDAAHLAVHFSPLRGARRAAVHVARCKELRKPRKAPPGLVTLAGGRTLDLRVEEARLERLLRGERRAEGSGPSGPPGPARGGAR